MREDIKPPKVEDVAMAIVKETNEEGESGWMVYFVNMRDHQIDSVLVRSNGYGKDGDETIKTSELRHFLRDVPAMTCVKVETIVEEVFHLSNQYWVSFFYDGKMYDKKYVFVPDAISDKNLVKVPIVFQMGVMIQ
jgi:hypothetical protein